MLFQPLADVRHRTLVRIWRRMWPVKNPNLFKQDNSHTAPFSLADFGAQFYEQRFDIAPLDVAACGAGEEQVERGLVLSLHLLMVPLSGTGHLLHKVARSVWNSVQGGPPSSKRHPSEARPQPFEGSETGSTSQLVSLGKNFFAVHGVDLATVVCSHRLGCL